MNIKQLLTSILAMHASAMPSLRGSPGELSSANNHSSNNTFGNSTFGSEEPYPPHDCLFNTNPTECDGTNPNLGAVNVNGTCNGENLTVPYPGQHNQNVTAELTYNGPKAQNPCLSSEDGNNTSGKNLTIFGKMSFKGEDPRKKQDVLFVPDNNKNKPTPMR